MSEWKQIFLMALEEHLNVSRAARIAGISRQRAYQERAADAGFREAWGDIEQQWTDAAEEELYRRAVEGAERPVFYKGAEVGRVREFSDQLLVAFLRAHRPEKYRERQDVHRSGGMTVRVEYADADESG